MLVTRSAAQPEPWSATPEPSGWGKARHAVNGWVRHQLDLGRPAGLRGRQTRPGCPSVMTPYAGLPHAGRIPGYYHGAGVARRWAEGKPVAGNSI